MGVKTMGKSLDRDESLGLPEEVHRIALVLTDYLRLVLDRHQDSTLDEPAANHADGNGSATTRHRPRAPEEDDTPGAVISDGEYGVEQAAKFLRVATVTVRKWIAADPPKIASHLNDANRRVILGKELLRLKVKMEMATTPDSGLQNGAAEAAA